MIENDAIGGTPTADRPIHVDFLYWQGCPSYEPALHLLNQVLEEERVFADVHLREVTSDAEAEELRFPGSPTIRIDGKDILEDDSLPAGLACRVYSVNGETSGVPPREMVVAALRAR